MGLLPGLMFVKTLVLFITLMVKERYYYLRLPHLHFPSKLRLEPGDTTTIIFTMIIMMVIERVILRQPHLQLHPMPGVEQSGVRLHGH